jgi:hypothetical protein
MDLLESFGENFDVNFVMKEFPANNSNLVNKLQKTGTVNRQATKT